MTRTRIFGSWLFVALTAALLPLSGCDDSGGTSSSATGTRSLKGSIKIDGSSTVGPISEAVSEEFGKLHKEVRVTVGISGTGGGFKRFTVGETDISNASRPIKAEEAAQANDNGVEFIEIPVAYDGLSIVVNLENTWADSLTVDELKKVFLEGESASTWADVRAGWPAEPIKIFAPGTDSGTFDYFKEVVAGKTGSIRADMSVSEDDNVLVTGVAGNKGAIGFFGCSYYFENQDKLRAVPIVNQDENKPVMPTPETIESGEYAPFSRPLFIYVNTKSADRAEVKAYVNFYFEKGPALAEEVGYVKLPQAVYDKAKANFQSKKTGTQYLNAAGDKVKGPITDVYK